MKLLITGAWRCTERQLDEIEQLGHSVVFMQNESEELPCDYASVEGVICNGLFLHHPIERFTSLRYIQLTSAGFDRVPMDYALSHGIAVNNARGVYSVPMAEFALSSVLSVYKQTDHFRTAQAAHRWDKHRGLRELFGKRVCIVGCGSVGSECALRFSAMGCEVNGIDAVPMLKNGFDSVLPVSFLYDETSASDITILTLPLTRGTRGIINRSMLEALPEGAVLVNISRGAVIDTAAMADVLAERDDVTAILDVFEEEPLDGSSPLWNMKNVIVTPHNSFVGEGNAERLRSVIIDNLRKTESK